MTPQTATKLAADYRRLERELGKARNRDSQADMNWCEREMARIEEQFQKADMQIEDYEE